MTVTFGIYKKVILIGMILAMCWLLLTGGTWDSGGTSMNYRYNAEFISVLNNYLDFKEIYDAKYSFPVPGLEMTSLSRGVCTEMVPQGICSAKDYILISAYDSGTSGKETYCSVIYIISNQDPENRSLLTVLELPDVTHAGGITFDGTYVWLAKGKAKACSAIAYEIIDRAAHSGKMCYKLDEYTETIDCGIRASFLVYEQGYLWIGTSTSKAKDGNLRRFTITTDVQGKLQLVQTAQMKIPAHANGITFSEIDGRLFMAVNCSWSRYLCSKVYLYEASLQGNTIVFERHGYRQFPPMLEESFSDGEHVYFLFESAATRYSTVFYNKCQLPVDRVCAVGERDLFDWV
jgi:hypothetical protein